MGVIFAPEGTVGKIWGHSWSQLGSAGATGIKWLEVKDATKQSTMHRTVPQHRSSWTKISEV